MSSAMSTKCFKLRENVDKNDYVIDDLTKEEIDDEGYFE